MRNSRRFLSLLSVVMLSGCSDIRANLGFERSSPDEFAVVTRAPLSLPPSYDLRPPRAGAPRPQEQTTTELAEQTLFGRPNAGATKGGSTVQTGQGNIPVKITRSASIAEQGFLTKAGVTAANPNIREVLDKETSKKPASDKGVIETLEDFSAVKKQDPLVEPAAEAKRIRDNQKAGAPVTKGDVKQAEPKQKTLWDTLGF
jgi:hypothetical protein